jgi:hypothetical protein
MKGFYYINKYMLFYYFNKYMLFYYFNKYIKIIKPFHFRREE